MQKNLRQIIYFLIVLPCYLAAQPFSFTSESLQNAGVPGDFFAPHGKIENLTSDTLKLRVKRITNVLPNINWSSSMCNGAACYAPHIEEYTVPDTGFFQTPPLAPGQYVDFALNVFSDINDPGSASVSIRVEMLNDATIAQELNFTFTTEATGLEPKDGHLSGHFSLERNYPNPFNPETVIPFEIGGTALVPTQINVYNMLGQLTKNLLNEPLQPGRYEVTWNAENAVGNPAPSGVYFYEIQAGDFREIRKMLLVR